eukprot:14961439-Alexandrium_andersonii.AAC.1
MPAPLEPKPAPSARSHSRSHRWRHRGPLAPGRQPCPETPLRRELLRSRDAPRAAAIGDTEDARRVAHA